jgi:hypothetical protein
MPTLGELLIFDLVRWIILFIEAYAAKHIYNIMKHRYQFQRQLLQIRLMFDYLQTENTSVSDSSSTPTIFGTSPAAHTTRQVLGQTLLSPSLRFWHHLALSIWIGNIYCTSVITINFLLHPITGYWVLSFLPLFIPLLFLPLPYLLNKSPLPTLLILGSGIGLGVVALLFFGV